MREAVGAGVQGGEGGTEKTGTVSAEMLTGRDTHGISRENQSINDLLNTEKTKETYYQPLSIDIDRERDSIIISYQLMMIAPTAAVQSNLQAKFGLVVQYNTVR